MSKTGVVKNWNEDKGFGFIGAGMARLSKTWGWVMGNLGTSGKSMEIWERSWNRGEK